MKLNPNCGCGCGNEVSRPQNKYILGHHKRFGTSEVISDWAKKEIVRIEEIQAKRMIKEINHAVGDAMLGKSASEIAKELGVTPREASKIKYLAEKRNNA